MNFLISAALLFLWDYDYSKMKGCANVSDTRCVESFEIINVKDGIIVGKLPATRGATTPTVGISLKVNDPRTGNQNYTVRAVGRDNTGARIDSPPSELFSVDIKSRSPDTRTKPPAPSSQSVRQVRP